MRVNAYILAADPAWIEASVMSYYDYANRIIVSYDENSRGWTGVTVDVEQCLKRIKAIDRDCKCRFSPGKFSIAENYSNPMKNETFQRQIALDEASIDADWVLQVDTDEIIADPIKFFDVVRIASAAGFRALEYPSRWLYKHVAGNRFLEHCGRYWQVAAGYPGPVAVVAGTRLKIARQCDEVSYHVDFRPYNTDPWRSSNTIIHQVVRKDQAIFHYAWIRQESGMISKSKSSGHALDIDWNKKIRHWLWAGRFPLLGMLSTPLLPRHHGHQLRISSIALHEKVKKISSDKCLI